MDIDLKSLCRLCAKRYDHSIDVLLKGESSESHNSFTNLIQEFFCVIIQAHDGLPSRICLPCKIRLETWERIREEVAQAQEYLTQCMLQQSGMHQVVDSRPENIEAHVIQTAGSSLSDSQIHWQVESVVLDTCSGEQSSLDPESLHVTHLEVNEQHWDISTPVDTLDTSLDVEDVKNRRIGEQIDRSWRDDVEFKCNICSKTFARKDNLRQHLVIHSGEKSFKCDKCPQSFSRASDLKVHYRIHTAEKPLQCHFCSQLFRESSNFRKHLRTHSGDRPFKCTVCNKHFAQSPHLKRHMRIHSGERPYQCEICSRQFSQSSTLRTHERTHSGAKPHTCKVCSRSFRHASTLKAHTRTHTGEKAFYCDKCPKSFFWRTSFDCHVLTHTSKKVN
ncbi:hypothetical protein B566_EDAN005308 [Ephemera danica]|nr:hypothetical protein B566_EDAN005308 [Ephemera danica]